MIPQSMVILFYKAAIIVADVIMACLRHPGCLPYGDVHVTLPPEWQSPNRDRCQQSTDVDIQTDDELLRLWDSAPEVECTHEGSPHRLTPDLVAKWDLVRNCTNIPMPPIQWVLYLDESACILVMDYIPGITLGEAWPTMGIWHKLRMVLTLQSYICQLRSIAHPQLHIPGPVLEGEKLGQCYASHIFGPMCPSKGPFATSEEFIELFNNRMDKATCACLCVHKGPLKDDGTLIYSHVDLAPRNLILGEDGWFEYVNMVMDAWLKRGKAYDAMWWASIPFIADPFLGIYDWMKIFVCSVNARDQFRFCEV
ncbi:hypothetical protein F5146DRAFT_1007485 [Armillaria mellea]|nr:hypothetical protein F5146DRAFT_1007485 [Armillaria mellea]